MCLEVAQMPVVKEAVFWSPGVIELATAPRLVLLCPLLEEGSITSQNLVPKPQDLPWVKVNKVFSSQ